MAGHTYVTKGYSTYTDIPSQEGGYDHRQNNHFRGYIVETTTIERVRGPIPGYTSYSGSPSKIELLKEYGHARHRSSEPKYGPHSGSPRGDYHNSFGPNHRTSSPTRHNEPNYETSSPTHHYRPNQHDTSSPPRHYGPNHGSSSPTRQYRPDYGNSSPTTHYEAEEPVEKFLNKLQIDASRPTKTGKYSSPNKHGPSSPTHNYNPEGTRLIRSGGLSGPKNNWQTAGPPATRHPLTTPTNDINEALSFLEESVNHPARSGPKRGGGVLDDLSTQTQPTEPARRYSKPIFGGTANNTRYKNNPISLGSEEANNTGYKNNPISLGSEEAMKKYGGTRV